MKMAKLILTPWDEIYEENKKVAMNQAFQEELEDRDIILKTQEGK